MNMRNKRTLKKVALAVLLCGSILMVSACKKAVSEETGRTERVPAQQEWTEQAPAQQEQEKPTPTESIKETADISKEEFEELPVLYLLDNATRIMESKAGVFTGDWNGDGVEDTLKIETAQQEGSDVICKLELALSGCQNPYTIENADCDFIDIVSGNFDTDDEAEILLLFDMKAAGANGCCGLQLLDKADSEYVNVTGDFFTGFDYTDKVQTGNVTGFYYLEILQGKEQDFIRIKQYIAGDFMTDHVGDMVTVLSFQSGKPVILDEKCVESDFEK